MHTHTHFCFKEEELLKKILIKEKSLLTVWFSVILSLEYYLFSQSFEDIFVLREAEIYLSLQGLMHGLPSWNNKNNIKKPKLYEIIKSIFFFFF